MLARIHRLAVDEVDAAALLGWLLVPGASRLASFLADLSADMDALVAGQLWLRIRTRPLADLLELEMWDHIEEHLTELHNSA